MLLSGQVTEAGMSNLFQYCKVTLFAIITIWFIRKREELLTYIKCIVIFSAANGAFAIYEQFFHIAERAVGTSLYRSSGFQHNANGLAVMMVTSLPLAYYLYIHEKNRFQKSIMLLSAFLMVFGVFFSVSRAGLLGLMFTVLRIFVKNIKRAATFFVMGLLLLGFSFFAMDLYKQRKTVVTTLSGKTQYDSSSGYRLELSTMALKLWLMHPVFGVGYQNFVESAKNEFGVHRRHVPHDIFLSLLCETGLPGLSLFILILIQSYKATASLKQRGDFYDDLAGYFQISLLAWIILLFFSTSINNAMMWIIIAFPFILDNIFHIEQLSKKEPT
jgi:O-antigen ligase